MCLSFAFWTSFLFHFFSSYKHFCLLCFTTRFNILFEFLNFLFPFCWLITFTFADTCAKLFTIEGLWLYNIQFLIACKLFINLPILRRQLIYHHPFILVKGAFSMLFKPIALISVNKKTLHFFFWSPSLKKPS